MDIIGLAGKARLPARVHMNQMGCIFIYAIEFGQSTVMCAGAMIVVTRGHLAR